MQATLPAKKRRDWTDEELLALPDDGFKYELLDGELTANPGYLDTDPDDVLPGFKCKLRRLFGPR